MRLFVDTNVLFDVFAQREPFVEDARRLLVMQAIGDAELWVAPQSILDVYYVLRKAEPSATLQNRIARSMQRINVCTTGHDDILSATRLRWFDLEDATIAVCCKKVGASYLITRDSDGFKELSIPIYSPADFFDMLERDRGTTYEIDNIG